MHAAGKSAAAPAAKAEPPSKHYTRLLLQPRWLGLQHDIVAPAIMIWEFETRSIASAIVAAQQTCTVPLPVAGIEPPTPNKKSSLGRAASETRAVHNREAS
jgi:hypothetical protein